MDKRYDYHAHEANIYQLWEKRQAFNPDRSANKQNGRPFTIIMPPPNANDPLHVGHAMFVSLEDALIRYHRMRGDDTAWIPGTDHAGIETQFVFEKKLQKEGKSRFNFDRQTLFNQIWEYVQENSGVAVEQMKKIGASADWSRYKFTLDEDVVDFVLSTFEKMHQDNLVYRDLQLVNYCTKCGTSYSELEVVYQDQQTPLYYVKYPLKDKLDEFVTVATVRPEPIFADTHLAVNPHDPERQRLVGQLVLNPLTGAEMPIIADEYVDPDFGTGIVKLTPAHDPHDFEVAKRHGLPINQAINTQGKITEAGGKYAGMSVKNAREAVVADLQAQGLIEKINEKYQNRVGTCYRCGRVIEPLPLAQFFIKVNDGANSLTKKALKMLDSGETKVHGAGQEKILRHWLGNLKDWNISRQIVWGIPIPVWYEIDGYEGQIQVSFIDKNGQYTQGILAVVLAKHSLEEILSGLQQTNAFAGVPYSVSRTQPATGNWLPETDTFDTWFSSSQWPVVTLKTNQEGDFNRFYPTSVMETAYDILMFWVMRMMMMGAYLTDQAPFRQVYLHGLIRDEKGQKMSKSKGNTINPLDVIAEFGADALRMALMIRSTPGQDKNVGVSDIKAMRNLTNKIWNASRFVGLQNENNEEKFADISSKTSEDDQEFQNKLQSVVVQITENMEKLQIGLAAETVYNEFWHWYCDECIESAKAGKLSNTALLEGLTVFLKLLHPFVPFVTEAVWQELRQQNLLAEDLLVTAAWPGV